MSAPPPNVPLGELLGNDAQTKLRPTFWQRLGRWLSLVAALALGCALLWQMSQIGKIILSGDNLRLDGAHYAVVSQWTETETVESPDRDQGSSRGKVQITYSHSKTVPFQVIDITEQGSSESTPRRLLVKGTIPQSGWLGQFGSKKCEQTQNLNTPLFEACRLKPVWSQAGTLVLGCIMLFAMLLLGSGIWSWKI